MKKNNTRFFILSLVAVVVLWAISAIIIYFYGHSWSERGTIGDMFGAVNALFSGLAFAGLLFTIMLQRQDIDIQREEMMINRKELEKSVEVQHLSQQALTAQVEQMHLTARLNAMNTVINYYNIVIANPNAPAEVVEKARQKRREIIKKIDSMIDDLDDTDVE